MKSSTHKFKKGKHYHVDDTVYIMRPIGTSFKNIDSDGNEEELSDDLICLRDCSVTIRWREEKERG